MSKRSKSGFALLGLGLLAPIAPINDAQAQASPSAYTVGYRYDAMRRLIGTISPDPDGAGGLKYAATRSTYDAAGRLIKVEAGELATWQSEGVAPSAWTGFTVFKSVETSYDAAGRKVKDLVKVGATVYGLTQYSYDSLSRLECTAVRMNAAVFGSLPASACAASTAGADGPDRITKNVYDAAGQLIQIRQAVGTSLEQAYVTYSYTPNGKREYVIDAKGNRAKLAYDGHDRQSHWYFPSKTGPGSYNGSTQATALSTAGAYSTTDYEQYGYDTNGNRTSLRKRDGQSIGYSYDALNRMTLKDIPGGTSADVYYGYDLRGLQLYARFVSASGQGVTSVYDGVGRITSATKNLGGVSRTLSYQYDANSNRTRLTFPDNNYFTYEYDGLDRVTAIKENGSTTVASLAYNNKGQRTSLSGGGTTSYTYDAIGRLASLGHDLTGTAQDVSLGFTAYNAASQLLTETLSNTAYSWTEHFNVTRGYATNGINQYTSAGPASFTYDANGNLTSDGGTTYVYDPENRLTSASGATSAGLSYDPLGRLHQTTGSATTQFLYDGDALVAEYDGSGTLLRRYVHGPGTDEPILWYEGTNLATRRTLRADHQGSVIAVTDSAGGSVAINSYDEYGIPASTNLGRFAYTGQIGIPDLKMYHYKARIYSPTLGRFLQTDPIGYDDQINLYAYVANDPVNATDPSGMFSAGIWNGNCSQDPTCYIVKGDQFSEVRTRISQSSSLQAIFLSLYRVINRQQSGTSSACKREPECGGKLSLSTARTVYSLLSTPIVASTIAKAWRMSNPNGATRTKNEHGFFIENSNGRYKPSGIIAGWGAHIWMGPPPSQGAIRFHTHPFFDSEGYGSRFSDQDLDLADRYGELSIVISHKGFFYYDAR